MHWKPMKRGDCNNSKAVGSSCATPSSKGWVSLGENSVTTFPILSFPCRFLQLANLLSTLLDVPFIRWDVCLCMWAFTAPRCDHCRSAYCIACFASLQPLGDADLIPHLSWSQMTQMLDLGWVTELGMPEVFVFSSLVSSAAFRKIEESQFEESQLEDAIEDVILAANY